MNSPKARSPRSGTLDPIRSAPGLVLASFLGTLVMVGLLSATVIPTEELEANKPQLKQTRNGDSLMLGWTAQSGVYYFAESSSDLNTWVSTKLLKDTTAAGNLSLGTAMGSKAGFYRLSLEGDPDSARLRADDDGDKISNLLEADAGMDAFETEASVDSDNDAIPDYFETFHFGTLDHDASYTAAVGGLTLGEAFNAGTDPRELDGDGDGMSNADEIVAGTDPNYDQTRNAPNDDPDRDGLTGAEERALGTFPLNPDSDGDGVKDGADGWPHDPNLTQPPLNERYVLIDLSTNLPYPSVRNSIQVDDSGGVLLAWNTSSGDFTTYASSYYDWIQTHAPEAFNDTLRVVYEESERKSPDLDLFIHVRSRANYNVVHLTRSGLLHFAGDSKTWKTYDGSKAHRDFDSQFAVVYDVANQAAAPTIAIVPSLVAIKRSGEYEHVNEHVRISRKEYARTPYARVRRYYDEWDVDEFHSFSAVVQHDQLFSQGHYFSKYLDSLASS